MNKYNFRVHINTNQNPNYSYLKYHSNYIYVLWMNKYIAHILSVNKYLNLYFKYNSITLLIKLL